MARETHPLLKRLLGAVATPRVALLRAGVDRLQRELDEALRVRDAAVATSAAHERGKRQALRAYNRYASAMRALDRYEHDSLTPGMPGWSERWAEDRRRVLLFAPKDHAGSMVQWARAINASTEWAARAVSVTPHEFGYATDLSYGVVEHLDHHLNRLLAEADVIHVKDEDGFRTGRNQLPADSLSRHGKPMVFTLYGSVSRERQDERDYRAYVDTFDATASLTPDLSFEWLRCPAFVGHAFDTEGTDVTWTDARSVGHSPSQPLVKATDAFMTAAERLRAERGIEIDLITGVSNRECVERKSRLGIFFDQAGRNYGSGRVIGWYGNAGLESAARGVPTIAHLSEQAFDRAALGGADVRDACGIMNTGTGTEAIYATMRDFFELDAAERAVCSKTTRAWVESFHGFSAVGPRLESIYATLV